jgi:hypothetical protein
LDQSEGLKRSFPEIPPVLPFSKGGEPFPLVNGNDGGLRDSPGWKFGGGYFLEIFNLIMYILPFKNYSGRQIYVVIKEGSVRTQ